MTYRAIKYLFLLLFVISPSGFAQLDLADWHRVPLLHGQHGFLSLTAQVDGVDKSFILDTATPKSVIYTSHGKGGTVAVSRFAIAGHETGIRKLQGHLLPDHIGSGTAGVIGLDALSALDALLLVKHNSLLIPKSSNVTLPVSKQIRLSITASGLALVETVLQGKTYQLVISSSAPTLLLDSRRIGEVGIVPMQHRNNGLQTQANQRKTITTAVTPIDSIQIGGLTFTDNFSLSDLTLSLGQLDSANDNIIGLLGLAELQQGNAAIDFANQILYWM